MKKTQLIDALAEKSEISKQTSKAAISVILEKITATIAQGGRVEIRGFGIFSRKYRPARTGMNPKTAQKISVREKFVPFFKMGKALKQSLNEKNQD